MVKVFKPRQCPICGCYMTMAKEYITYRCTDPGHWIAAGELAANDFCGMARMVALARDNEDCPSRPSH